jgi:hypothetical protein
MAEHEEQPSCGDKMIVDGDMSPITAAAASAFNAPTNTPIASMEQIYSPILIRRGRNRNSNDLMSAFEMPEDTAYSSSIFGGEHIGPTRRELDPYFTTVVDNDDQTPMKKCDFHFGLWITKPENEEPPELNLRKTSREIDAALVPHFRGPLIMSGWGYDHADLPVPYIVNDPEIDEETGEKTLGGYEFDPCFIENRGTWKSGPIDLKWDYQRKVWGAGHQILVGVADQDIVAPCNPCEPTEFKMKVLRRTMSPEIESGEASLNPDLTNWYLAEELIVRNRDPSLEQDWIENMVFVIAVRVNYEWLPLWVGCPTGAPCPGGSGELKDTSGNIIGKGDCFCFLSDSEEKDYLGRGTGSKDHDNEKADCEDAPTPDPEGGGGEGGGGGGGGEPVP